ncbi:glycosyltransferase family 2 protein [Rhodoblastus sp.]
MDHKSSSLRQLTVAAIIPLYNGAPYIRESLNSVLAQSEPADEIIVVNDGSTDDGPEIVKEMATRHPIRLISRPNGGIGSARNCGIAEAKSTHIALLDQDDIWYEDHLAILKKSFVESDILHLAVVYGNVDKIDRAGRMIMYGILDAIPSQHPKTSLLECLKHDMFVLPGASLFCKEAFEKAGRFDERLSGYEDDDFFLRVFLAGFKSVYLSHASVLKWRFYSSSTSHSPKMSNSRMVYFRKLVDMFPYDPAIHINWTRDVIAPRFFHIARGDFIEAMRRKDRARADLAWSDLEEISGYLHELTQLRLKLVVPLIKLTYWTSLRSVASNLLHWASQGRRIRLRKRRDR